MQRYIMGRLVAAIPVVITTAVIIFVIMRLLPGDPVVALTGQSDTAISPEVQDQLRRQWGLDEPLWIQFGIWLGKMATGDFGTTFVTKIPVTELIGPRLGPTLQITMMGWIMGVSVGLLIGSVSAMSPNSKKDWVLSVTSLGAAAAPFFLVGILLMFVFALNLHLLPASGYTPLFQDPIKSLKSTIMPATGVALGFAAVIGRYMRSSLVEVLEQPYITTARSKGLKESTMVRRHALRNSMLPIVTILGFSLADLFAGSVITERLFAIPGMGRLLVDSVAAREYAVVQAIVFLFAFTTILANLLVDIMYATLDPRIRLGGHSGR